MDLTGSLGNHGLVFGRTLPIVLVFLWLSLAHMVRARAACCAAAYILISHPYARCPPKRKDIARERAQVCHPKEKTLGPCCQSPSCHRRRSLKKEYFV